LGGSSHPIRYRKLCPVLPGRHPDNEYYAAPCRSP
jgi:hypothetical protein